MPMTIPVLPYGRGSPSIDHVQDHVRDRVFEGVGVAVHDDDGEVTVGPGGVHRAEVDENFRPTRGLKAIDLLHAERGLVEARQRDDVGGPHAHGVQRDSGRPGNGMQ